MVAICDCIETASFLLQSNPEKWGSANLEITGPSALTYEKIAAEMSRALNEAIRYFDISEEEFATMLFGYGFPKASVIFANRNRTPCNKLIQFTQLLN
jgi:uncharacterized protein YbjT (DUF2867 family)